MVEVTPSISSASMGEESQSLSPPKLHINSNRSSDDHMAAVRRTAASKRSMLKVRASRSSSGLPATRDESKSPNSPSSSADEDPKRSKAEKSTSPPSGSPESPVEAPPLKGLTKPLLQRRTRNHSAPLFLAPMENDVTKTSKSPKIICDVSCPFVVVYGLIMFSTALYLFDFDNLALTSTQASLAEITE